MDSWTETRGRWAECLYRHVQEEPGSDEHLWHRDHLGLNGQEMNMEGTDGGRNGQWISAVGAREGGGA